MVRVIQLLAASTVVFCFIIFTLYRNNSFASLSDHSQLPDPRLIIDSQDQNEVDGVGILEELGVEFLPNFKNPCWYELKDFRSKEGNRANFYFSLARSSFHSKYRYKKQSDVILRCLPYFFLIGQPKCATTDVFQRINIHPDVIEPMVKGPHWWTRRRYGPPYSTHPVTLTEYLDVFNASKIEGETINSFEAPHKWFHEKITGDCSTSTLWDSSATMSYLHSVMSGDVHEFITRKLLARRLVSTFTSVKNSSHAKINSSENTRVNDVDEHLQEFKYPQYHGTQDGIVLPFTVADAIHSVLPKSQIIAVIREPVSRLYSSYLFFTKKTNLSPEKFDQNVKESIRMWHDCTRQYSDRTCAYNKTLQNCLGVRLYNGLYSVFLRDWLKVFDPEQVLVVRMEDYHQNITNTIATIYNHLGLK
ncbi:carbohydrate sulfotransferase 15-like isoform X2 [Homarus americanus]|uniref:carbohydrate sulfotransferase 15-like isoform X2 n=1 Tax=Homarus americanus TaxID=6706 RepID=UPI001C484582|nr:carbohydrate sulfotransferase 15-like isoform X2 [Homarus americanus]